MQLAQNSLLKSIRLGASPAECRLVPRSGNLRLVRHVAQTGIAPVRIAPVRIHMSLVYVYNFIKRLIMVKLHTVDDFMSLKKFSHAIE